MNGYLYIEDLFRTILKESTKIGGRFHVSYKYGAQEINSDQLGEVLTEIRDSNKYPLVMMAPPHSQVEYSNKLGEWERYRIILFFCNTTYYEGNAITNPNPKTKTSTKSISTTWDEMKTLAANFMRDLSTKQRITPNSTFRLPVDNKALIIPFSITGQDRVSGIRIHFDFDVFVGCDDSEFGRY